MIVNAEKTSWKNEYGYDEGYTWKEITMRKSGHLWFKSAMETDDSCGNCDGAHCDLCRDIFEVYKFSEPKPHIHPKYGWHDYNYQDTLVYRIFSNEEEAKDFYETITL